MERKFYTDNFEQLLKEKSDEFRMYPSKRVWHSIYNDLHPGRKWPSVAVSLVLIIALLMVGYWNNNNSNAVTIADAAQKNIPNTTTQVPGNNNAGAVTTTAPQSTTAAANTVASSANTPTSEQGRGTLNNAATLHSQQNAIVGANNTNSRSSASLSVVNTNNSLQQVAADHNQIIIAVPNDMLIAENGAAVYNNSQKPVSGSSVAGNNEKLNTGTANVIAIIGNYSFAGTTAITSSLQQKATQAIASAAINSTPVIITEEDAALLIAGNNEEEIITIPSGVAINNTANTELNNSNNPEDLAANSNTGKKETTAVNKDNKSSVYKKITSNQDKEWIEDYAFHNKSRRKNWQDRTAFEFYITPSVGYSKLSNEAKYNLPAAAPSFSNGGATTVSDANKAVSRRPGLGFEAGFSVNYSLAKKLVVKAGIQANYTNYGINADETNHPILTTLMLIDPNSGYPYMSSALTTLSNLSGSQPVVLHNKTYQVSIPLGFAFKVSGNDKLAWYTGATIQPSFVAGGKAYLISADRNNFVADPSLIRKWNVNAGFETYISYKFDGFTLQAGPQFRYQLLSTYYKKYTVNENLSNIGIKIGMVKNF